MNEIKDHNSLRARIEHLTTVANFQQENLQRTFSAFLNSLTIQGIMILFSTFYNKKSELNNPGDSNEVFKNMVQWFAGLAADKILTLVKKVIAKFENKDQ